MTQLNTSFDFNSTFQQIQLEAELEERQREEQRRRQLAEAGQLEIAELQKRDSDTFSDILRGIGNGVIGFGQSVGTLVDKTAEGLFGVDLIDDEVLNTRPFGETTTVLGSLAEGLVQFASALIPGGVLARAGGRLLGLGSKAQTFTKFAAADALAFKGNEPRLSDVAQSIFEGTILENPITDFLASDKDDSEFLGRIKNVLEGIGLGAVFSPFSRVLKNYKNHLSKGLEEASEETSEAALKDLVEMEDVINKVAAGEPLEEAAEEGVLHLRPASLGERLASSEQFPALADEMTKKVEKVFRENKNKPLEDIIGDVIRLFNTDHLLDDKTGAKLWDLVGTSITPHIKDFLKTQTNKVTKREAVRRVMSESADSFNLGSTGMDNLLNEISRGAAEVERSAVTLIQAKTLLNTLHKQIRPIASAITSGQIIGPAKDEALGRLFRLQGLTARLAADIEAFSRGGGRLVQSGNIRFGKVNLRADVDAIKSFREAGLTDPQIDSMVARLAASDSDKALVSALDERVLGRRVGDAFMEIYVNGLLSGVGTQAVNVVSTAVQSMLLPMERMFGGLLNGDTRQIKEGLRTYVGMFMSVSDSVRMAWKSFKAHNSFVDLPSEKMQVIPKALTADNLGATGTVIAPFIDAVGGITRMPSRMLGTADEFFKQMLYRGDAYARGVGTAVEEGLTSATDISTRAWQLVNDSFSVGGRGLDEEALRVARRGTFTTPFAPGTFGKSFETFLKTNPAGRLLRVFVPFVRTPLNIITETIDRTPLLGQMRKSLRQQIESPNPRIAAEALGRVAMGNTFFMAMTTMAFNGVIQGFGPVDERERQKKMMTGWRPYSVEVGDQYIEFSRLDPWGAILGMAADYASMASELSDDENKQHASSIGIMLANNLTNKTYLRGISELANVLVDPENNFEQWSRNFVSSLVPNILRDFNGDPHLREVQTLTEALARKVNLPWMGVSSRNLAPKRDMLGEPIEAAPGAFAGVLQSVGIPNHLNPVKSGTETTDKVRKTIASLPVRTSLPAKSIEGIDTSQFINPKTGQNAWDRLQQLVATTKISGKTLHESLLERIESQRFKALEEFDNTGKARASIIEKTISRFRLKARKQMFKEFPELEALIRNERKKVVNARIEANRAAFLNFINNNPEGN